MDALQEKDHQQSNQILKTALKRASAKVSGQLDKEISLAVMPSWCCVELTDDIREQTTRQSVVPSLFYEGSTDTSDMLVSSYMCHHHLTGQAREDLLQLSQLFLPNNHNLPSSLYILNKQTFSSQR